VALQVRYANQDIPESKSARARGSYLRVSFKNTRETAQAINGWKLGRAVAFLENVKEKKEAVPFRRYAGGIGRTAQGMQYTHIFVEFGGGYGWMDGWIDGWMEIHYLRRYYDYYRPRREPLPVLTLRNRQAVWCHARPVARQVG